MLEQRNDLVQRVFDTARSQRAKPLIDYQSGILPLLEKGRYDLVAQIVAVVHDRLQTGDLIGHVIGALELPAAKIEVFGLFQV